MVVYAVKDKSGPRREGVGLHSKELPWLTEHNSQSLHLVTISGKGSQVVAGF